MEAKSTSTSLHRTDQWQSLVGEIVEVRLHGTLYRRGLVDDAMPDASGIWIAQEAASLREYISKGSGFEIWTSLYPASPLAGIMSSGE